MLLAFFIVHAECMYCVGCSPAWPNKGRGLSKYFSGYLHAHDAQRALNVGRTKLETSCLCTHGVGTHVFWIIIHTHVSDVIIFYACIMYVSSEMMHALHRTCRMHALRWIFPRLAKHGSGEHQDALMGLVIWYGPLRNRTWCMHASAYLQNVCIA